MHDSGAHKRTAGRGFTLVELLLVLLISSVIVLAINAVYRQAHQIWASVEDPRPIYHDARAVIETLRQELSCLYFPPAPDANDAENGAPFEPILVGTNEFAFYTLAPSWRTGLPASRIAKVRYSLSRDPVTEQNILERFEQLCAGEKAIGKEVSDIVTRGLSQFSVSVVEGGQEESSDDDPNSNRQAGPPPQAVKVSLKWPATENIPECVFETTILVPAQTALTR
jgi:prepilin-type N-terminal cleavage/methylation domain-containing protein